MKVCITYAACCNLINVNYVELHGGGASGYKPKWLTMPALAYRACTHTQSSAYMCVSACTVTCCKCNFAHTYATCLHLLFVRLNCAWQWIYVCAPPCSTWLANEIVAMLLLPHIGCSTVFIVFTRASGSKSVRNSKFSCISCNNI